MTYSTYGQPLPFPPSVRHKVFVSYYHHGDQNYYDTFSLTFDSTYDLIHDHSLDRIVDSDNPEYVMRRIRENYVVGSSCTVVLVGAYTWGRKYVDWEIKATLDKGHGLVGICLPTAILSSPPSIRWPPRLLDNIKSGFAPWLNWTQIMESPHSLAQCISDAKSRSQALIVNDRSVRSRNS